MLTLRPAASLAFSELLALWNAAYAGYLAPLSFDEPMLKRHVRRSGLDLDRSVVGQIDGAVFGVSFAAFRATGSLRRAWIGGFGVAEPFRRRGLATRLLGAHLQRLQEVAEVWLEVIDRNPAREVYRRCGFTETRDLKLFEGALAAGAHAGEVLGGEALAARHAALNPVRPSWRRDLPTLMDSITMEGAEAVGVEGAYALAGALAGRLIVHDAAAAGEVQGRKLLGALARRWPGLSLRLVDEPSGSPLAAACASAGLANSINQVEMARKT